MNGTTLEDYIKAQKIGKASYRRALSKGEYPYLPALDEITSTTEIRTEQPLGMVNIPLDQIVGTKTAGRQRAFACDFMPLMPEHSEFAVKWQGVVEYHMSQGVGDPIVAYEYMNKFYVLEGNKRVSVLKYFGADSIEGTVTRLVPVRTEDLENKIYYEFMDFYHDSGINYIWFTQLGSFKKLSLAIGKKPGEAWSDLDRENFKSLYLEFSEIFKSKGGDKLNITPADALLFYMSLYPYEDILNTKHAEKVKDIDKIFSELPAIGEDRQTSLVYKPDDTPSGNVFTRFFRATSSRQLKVAFIHDKRTADSSWTYSHELGRMALDQIFGDQIHTEAFFLQDEDADIAEVLETAIAGGNHMIFTTHQRFLAASLKAAIEHPEVKILNCSVGQPHPALRTYYGRLFEAKYLSGMIAGAMTPNDKIAYRAQYPIFGSMANINAFTLGARMTNPRAQIYLHWSSLADGEPLDQLCEREEISVISGINMIRPRHEATPYGLYMKRGENSLNLAAPIWNWGRFYEKIIRDFLQGNWDSTSRAGKPAINYWWGISSGIIDLITSNNLPSGVKKLVEIMKSMTFADDWQMYPFDGEMTLQDGTTVGGKGRALSASDLISMDYLLQGVVGEIPDEKSLTKEAQEMIAMERLITPQAAASATVDTDQLDELKG